MKVNEAKKTAKAQIPEAMSWDRSEGRVLGSEQETRLRAEGEGMMS